ncbi:MAG: hypothetical protein WC677_00365 [Clostridia bacterium]|jgi:hypothetical protein
MSDSSRTVLTIVVLVVIFLIAMSLLRWLIAVLLPAAIVIIACYLIYKVFFRGR